jgi:acyl-coenzyme A thioesterase PaaI-like protein
MGAVSDERSYLDDVPAHWLAESAALAEATRGLVEAVALTDVAADDLVRVRREVEALATQLREHHRAHALRPRFGDLAALRERPPAEGLVVRPGNPGTIALAVHLEGDRATATWTAGPVHEGPPDALHGGTSAWLLDSVLGSVVQAGGTPAVTGTLELRYRRPVPLGVPLQVSARIGERSGRRIAATGRIEVGGETLVEATATFVTVAMS